MHHVNPFRHVIIFNHLHLSLSSLRSLSSRRSGEAGSKWLARYLGRLLEISKQTWWSMHHSCCVFHWLFTCILFILFRFFIIPIRYFDSLLCTVLGFSFRTFLFCQLVKSKYGCLGFRCFKDRTLLYKSSLRMNKCITPLFDHAYFICFGWLVATNKTTRKVITEHQDFATFAIRCWAYSGTFLTSKRRVFQVVGDLCVNLQQEISLESSKCLTCWKQYRVLSGMSFPMWNTCIPSANLSNLLFFACWMTRLANRSLGLVMLSARDISMAMSWVNSSTASLWSLMGGSKRERGREGASKSGRLSQMHALGNQHAHPLSCMSQLIYDPTSCCIYQSFNIYKSHHSIPINTTCL